VFLIFRRRSTLAIRRHPEADSEWYECVARDVDGNEISHVFPPIKKPKERNHTGTSTTSTESPNLGRGKIDTAAHPSPSRFRDTLQTRDGQGLLSQRRHLFLRGGHKRIFV
jgi:hypothetical protein